MILKNWVTCGENSMALVGFLVALSVSAKLRWARHFELTDSKESWILGKTGDWYSEEASRGHQKVSSQSLVAKLFLVSSFFVTNKQNTLKISTKTSKNPSTSLKIL